jgi:hypothetical protein
MLSALTELKSCWVRHCAVAVEGWWEMRAKLKPILLGLVLLFAGLPGHAFSSDSASQGESTPGESTPGESLSGYYSREGNGGSPAQAARNNIYIRFFPERWLAMLFLPYPYAEQVASKTINQVFDTARAQTTTSAYLRGTFATLEQEATLQIERYGYLEDRIVFECGSLAPCTIRLGDGYLELIKPGVINEHIIRYRHIDVE